MFLLNAQINYGAAFTWSYLNRVSQVAGLKEAQWDDFKGIHGFFTIAGTFKGIFIGGQVFLGTPISEGKGLFNPHYYGGIKGVLGFNFDDLFYLYGGVGFEAESITNLKKQVNDAAIDARYHKKDWFKNMIFSADADLYFSQGIGCGITLSGRLPQTQDNLLQDQKSFSAVRIMAKLIFRHI